MEPVNPYEPVDHQDEEIVWSIDDPWYLSPVAVFVWTVVVVYLLARWL